MVSFSPIATLGNRGLQESHHFPRKPKNEDVGQTCFVSRLPSLAGPAAAPLRAGQSALRPHTSLVHRGLRPGLVPLRPPGQTSSLGSQLGSPWLSSSARASGGPWGPATRTVPGQPCASRQRGGSHLRPAVTPDCLQALPLLLFSLPWCGLNTAPASNTAAHLTGLRKLTFILSPFYKRFLLLL